MANESSDLYAALGLPKTASTQEIRAAYRKLARRYHPDVNPDDKEAEEKFKQIALAYEVLSDEKKRQAYDEFGAESLRSGFDAEQARAYRSWRGGRRAGGSPFDGEVANFDFSDLFGGGFKNPFRQGRRGTDIQAVAELDLAQVVQGAEVKVQNPQDGSVLTVRVPPGAEDGSTLRVSGKGLPGPKGAPAGDLIIETRVRPHPWVRREGLDLSLRLPVTLEEAYLGASVEVPTFEGKVKVKIPPRSQSGTRLRLRDKGIPRGQQRGHFYVELEVRMPDVEDQALAEALRASSHLYSRPPREGLKL